MTQGIRATVVFPRPVPCPIADASGAIDSVIDRVWTSVAGGNGSRAVSEFLVEAPDPPNIPDVEHVLSVGGRHVLRFAHGREVECPCACLGEFGCAPHRYLARDGTLRLVFNAVDYDELQSVVAALRDRFPDVDVRRLVRSPAANETRDDVFVDRGRLTERQLEVLQTAHAMGYFERPRRANATAVAAELGVDQSTFAEHLAAAQSKVFEDILEDAA